MTYDNTRHWRFPFESGWRDGLLEYKNAIYRYLKTAFWNMFVLGLCSIAVIILRAIFTGFIARLSISFVFQGLFLLVFTFFLGIVLTQLLRQLDYQDFTLNLIADFRAKFEKAYSMAHTLDAENNEKGPANSSFIRLKMLGIRFAEIEGRLQNESKLKLRSEGSRDWKSAEEDLIELSFCVGEARKIADEVKKVAASKSIGKMAL